MLITVPKVLQLMSCGSRIESYVCLPAKPTLWPLSLMSTPSPVRKMEANGWFVHSPAGVEEEGLSERLASPPPTGRSLMPAVHSALSPKEGFPGSEPEQPDPQSLVQPTGMSRIPSTPKSFPWP